MENIDEDEQLNVGRNEDCEVKIRKTGCWSREEHEKYLEFLTFSRKLFHSRRKRKYLLSSI
jgi:hypothetical protein